MKRSWILGSVVSLCFTPFALVRAGDTYQIDASHTTVGFSITHLVISEVQGRFNEFNGALVLDPANGNRLVAALATIQAKSIDTGVARRDDHLRSPDFFDVEKFPTITYEAKEVASEGDQQVLVGQFTIHGVTKELRLPVTLTGPIKDPWGHMRIGLKGQAKLNRKDFGLTWNKVLETGGLTVGEEVEIRIHAEAIKVEPEKK